MSRRVVITGMGVISPLGNSLDSLWDSLSQGKSGVAPIQSIPSAGLPTSIAGECRDFTGHINDFGELPGDVKKSIRKGLKVMCRESQMGVASAQLALAHANFAEACGAPERYGVVFGADYMLTEPEELREGILKCGGAEGKFDYDRWGVEGLDQMTPLWLLKYLPNMPASHIAIYNDLRGPNNSITHREAAANLAIGEAFHTILRDSADRMVAGATGTRVHQMKAVHAAQTEQLADNPDEPGEACRPFDRNRTGMVLGEGAATIVMEEIESAKSRGANILAEILGAASSSVADRNLVARRDVALANAMRGALRDGGLSPSDVSHIHAHGLSTVQCDADEYRALTEVFGDRAQQIPVVAAKSYFGNLGAASGMVELIASVLSLQHGKLFPVLNFQDVDDLCPVAAVTDHSTSPGDVFLNLSVTPQGQAAAVLVRAA
jgi:3-oxoacyl-[acyl-carrier-protein] synthase II